MLAVHRNPPTMSEVRTTPITTNHDGANDLTQLYSFLKCFYLFYISNDQRTHTGIAFLDFSKAFNSVSPAFTPDQKIRSIWDKRSPTAVVHQLSDRDPYLGLLCLPYLSTICRVLCLTNASTLASLFADDAQCFHTIRSVSDCEWSDEGKLVCNSDKCSLCSITSKREPIMFIK